MIGGPTDGPHALALGERLLEILDDAGLSPVDASHGSYLLIVYTFGSMAFEAADLGRPGSAASPRAQPSSPERPGDKRGTVPGMDDQELTRRGPQLVLGAAMITLGGLLTLFGVMYGPLAQPETELGAVAVSDRARDFATMTAVAAALLGLGATYCYRGSIPMMFASLVVVAAAGHNLVQLLPYY